MHFEGALTLFSIAFPGLWMQPQTMFTFRFTFTLDTKLRIKPRVDICFDHRSMSPMPSNQFFLECLRSETHRVSCVYPTGNPLIIPSL